MNHVWSLLKTDDKIIRKKRKDNLHITADVQQLKRFQLGKKSTYFNVKVKKNFSGSISQYRHTRSSYVSPP